MCEKLSHQIVIYNEDNHNNKCKVHLCKINKCFCFLFLNLILWRHISATTGKYPVFVKFFRHFCLGEKDTDLSHFWLKIKSFVFESCSWCLKWSVGKSIVSVKNQPTDDEDRSWRRRRRRNFVVEVIVKELPWIQLQY